MPGRTYRLEVEGELMNTTEWVLHGMSVMHAHGNTLLEGTVRDQAELNGLLQQVANLGLTLLRVNAIDDAR
jgi:hypothetical protein